MTTIYTQKEFNKKLSSIKTRNTGLRIAVEELLQSAIAFMFDGDNADTRQIADLLNATKGEYAAHTKLLGYIKEQLPCLVQGVTKDKKIKFKVDGEAVLETIEAANHWTWKNGEKATPKTNQEKLLALLEKMEKKEEHIDAAVLDRVAALIVKDEPVSKAA